MNPRAAATPDNPPGTVAAAPRRLPCSFVRSAISRFTYSTLFLGLAGAAMLWAAMPPLDWWPMAWIAPMPWVWIIRVRRLQGRRPYASLAAAWFCFWMAALHWLRLPHPATSIGWVAISLYFSVYLPLFVWLSRAAVHRLRVPVALAAPIVWTGLELVRAHLFTGLTIGNIGYTQYRWTALIQLGDLAGIYGVGFLVMFAAASLTRIIPCDGRRRSYWPILPAVVAMAAALLYGHLRMTAARPTPGPTIALIQGSVDIEMRHDPERKDRVMQEYVNLSHQAVEHEQAVDLIVWPETMFLNPLVTFDEDVRHPPDATGTDDDFRRWLGRVADDTSQSLKHLARSLDAHLLLGIDGYHFQGDRQRCFNSAAFISRDGRLVDRYDKMHLVMFGEYVPFADKLPWLQRLTPLPLSVTPGDRPAVFGLNGVRLAPSICFETVLPHVIRRQVNALAAEGREPDVLVNLTNDGWFWGSSELDMHLICGVFRAVECRKPLLIAANTGFSAWIDADGRLRRVGPRRAEQVVIARPDIDRRRGSWYLRHGDWFAGACLAGCVIFGLAEIVSRRRDKKRLNARAE